MKPWPREPVKQLESLTHNYRKQRTVWAVLYYSARVSIIVLGTAIPIMTIVAAGSDVMIAVAGGLIVAVEGVSRLFKFHERYLYARVLFNGLKREWILYFAPIADSDKPNKDVDLASKLARLVTQYDAMVLEAVAAQGSTPGSPPEVSSLANGLRRDVKTRSRTGK